MKTAWRLALICREGRIPLFIEPLVMTHAPVLSPSVIYPLSDGTDCVSQVVGTMHGNPEYQPSYFDKLRCTPLIKIVLQNVGRAQRNFERFDNAGFSQDHLKYHSARSLDNPCAVGIS